MALGSLLSLGIGAAGAAFGGAAGGSVKPAEVDLDLGENEVLKELLDLSQGTLQGYQERGDQVFAPNPDAADEFQNYFDNQLKYVAGGQQGINAANDLLQGYIAKNNLAGGNNQINALNQRYIQEILPGQQSKAVERAFENTLGRAPTGSELAKYADRLSGGGYTDSDVVTDLSLSQEYKDKYGTGGALDAYYDSYYGKRGTVQKGLTAEEKQEYQRSQALPTLDAISERYGLGSDFGGYDTYKAKQYGYSDQEIIDYLDANRGKLAGVNAEINNPDSLYKQLKTGGFTSYVKPGLGMVPIDRGVDASWTRMMDQQASAIPYKGPETKEALGEERTFTFTPDNFTEELYAKAGMTQPEATEITGSIAEIETAQQQRRDDRKYLYNSGLKALQGDIDKDLLRIRESSKQRIAKTQGQYGMLAGIAGGLFS